MYAKNKVICVIFSPNLKINCFKKVLKVINIQKKLIGPKIFANNIGKKHARFKCATYFQNRLIESLKSRMIIEENGTGLKT
jgi:hypothetical protein